MIKLKQLGLAVIVGSIGFSSLALADASILKSKTGQAIGMQVYDYKYEEPGLMNNKGTKAGITYEATQNLGKDWYLGGDFRYALGNVDYDGSGTKSGNKDRVWEAKVIGGRDYAMSGFVMSPYMGIGYRNLYNDLRGTTSTNAAGYRRESEYVYLPLGVTHRFHADGGARISTNIEYDHLIVGKQDSSLSDTGLGYSDMTNKQKKGYGIKLSSSYERKDWSVGVFYNYWNIADSETETLYQNGSAVGTGIEPKNNTQEVGFQGKYRF